jgi:hypothetical protein
MHQLLSAAKMVALWHHACRAAPAWDMRMEVLQLLMWVVAIPFGA